MLFVPPGAQKCSTPAFLCTAADGYDVDYLRVPVTDEKAPKPSDFQLLIQVGHAVRVMLQ
jgi:hypothetical protein